VRPGDQHPADHDRRGDDSEITDADQPVRAQRARQVDYVDDGQRGQCQRAYRARGRRRALVGLPLGDTSKH